MTIQLNTDKNLAVHEAFGVKLNDLLSEEFNRFSENITRIEVHLSDKNGKKEGRDDIHCMVEARLEGMQPIAVTADADTIEQAVAAAINKLKNSLDTILGRQRNY